MSVEQDPSGAATRPATTWWEIRRYLGSSDTGVTDAAGLVWRRTSGSTGLYRWDGGELRHWDPAADEIAILPEPPIAEPPDGTRLEFAHHTDVYAAHRDDESSRAAGYADGYGWLLYGETVPCTWPMMYAQFGDSLRSAVRLVPVAQDLPNRARWFPGAPFAPAPSPFRRRGAEHG